MKKRWISKLILTVTLIATVPMQSFSIHAATTHSTTAIPAEKSTIDLGANSTYDTTDGNTNVTWPAGPKANSLTSDSAILMDADTGLILYGKNITDKRYPASITKILTTLLCVEHASLGETVTFTADEVTNLEYGASNINTQVGEKLTMDQCLYGIMLSSANEVCNGVADHIAGSTEAFADLMNQKASEIGCVNTHFTNANGLHDDNHYTCAYDMALIGKAALQNSTFRKVAGTKVYYMNKTNKSDKRQLVNHHNMLYAYSTSAFLNNDCIGGKTGYTSVAQSTLVTFAKRGNTTLVCVVMHGGSSKTNLQANIYTDTKSLLDFGFSNYQSYDLSGTTEDSQQEDSPFFTEFNSVLDPATAPLKTSSSGKITLPVGIKKEKAKQKATFFEKGQAKEEHEIGNVTYTYGNKTVGGTNIFFDADSCPHELIQTSDLHYENSRHIAGKAQTTMTIIRRIAIGIAIAFVIGFVLFYFLVIRKQRQLKKRYQTTRNKY